MESDPKERGLIYHDVQTGNIMIHEHLLFVLLALFGLSSIALIGTAILLFFSTMGQ